ncbi:hypothetical protein [Nocardia sp. NPDC050718]|uniref:hypothetical protein n=1 Tax=Nocardia sp. NPDC050718 TaxID=3155788 RepID=UPI0033D2CFE3
MVDSVGKTLDDGAIALQYFIQLSPHYLEVFGNDGGLSVSQAEALYDEERGMNLESLSATATGLQQMLAAATQQGDKQRDLTGALAAAWQGEAADAGNGVVADIASRAATDRGTVNAAVGVINSASALLITAVQAKASLCRALLLADGKNVYVAEIKADEIDNIITGKKEGWLRRDVYKKLFGNEILSGYTDETKQECDRWLREVFKPDYDARIEKFRQICASTKTSVEDQYKLIAVGLETLEVSPYPAAKGSTVPVEQKPTGDQSKLTGDQSKVTGDQTTTAGTQSGDQSKSDGGQTTTAGTQSGDTTTTGSTAKTTTGTKDTSTTDDDSTDDDDSDTSEALSTLTSTISELGTTLSEALTGDLGDTLTSAIESVGTSISDGIEQMTEQASALLSGETEASFQIGDTKVSIGAGTDGLTLTTTDANGGSTQYKLALDENGIPVLTQDSTSADGSTTGQSDETGVLGSGTPQSGTGQGEAGLTDAGTGGRGGADATTSETPDLTNAPVTSEIGSGEQSSGSVAGGVPVGPRSTKQETDGEHVPSVEDHPVSDPGDSGAVLAEAGPL